MGDISLLPSMAYLLFINTARRAYIVGIVVTAFAVLAASLLLGFLGPQAREEAVDYAYGCPSNYSISVFDPAQCGGVQLGKSGTNYTYEVGPLKAMNSFWSVVMYPYRVNSQVPELNTQISVQVSIAGRNDPTDEWTVLEDGQVESEKLYCESDELSCWGFVLVYEDRIRYSNYLLTVSLPAGSTNDQIRHSLGNFAFEYQWGHAPFASLQIAMRLYFFLQACVLLGVFGWTLHNIPRSEWYIEHYAAFGLLLSLLALNNPFYPFKFLFWAGLFSVLDSFAQALHLCVLLFFWVYIFDFTRRGAKEPYWTKNDWSKLIAVSVYGLITLVLFIWFRVADNVDPVYGTTESSWVVTLLFFADASIYGVLVICVLLLMGLSIAPVHDDQYLLPRFLMTALPSLFVILSLVGAFLFGVFGPVHRTAPSFVYFCTLYNLYVAVLLVGYWPLRTAFHQGVNVPSERTPIYSDTFMSYKEDQFA